jgi:FtsH-binding integral membrane protein
MSTGGRMSKLSYGIIAGGISIIISSTVRWFFLFPSWSQLSFGVSIGFLITFLGYAYGWMKQTDKEIAKLSERMDNLASWWTKNETTTAEEIARWGK